MQGEELRARVKLCIGMAAGHPAWWVVAFFTTLVIDRPLQFLFGSLFLTGRSEVFPSIIDLTSGRDSLLSMFIVVSAVLLVVGKALDYWGQSTLIALADGEASGTGEGMAEAVRRGWRALAVYTAAVLPVDLVRYLLLLLPGFAWLAWRGFDPDFDYWCAYTLIILAWLFICVPLAVALGVFSELAGREVMLGASRPPTVWRSARELGWGNRRAVLEAWLPTLAADLVVAAVICALSFGGAWLLFVTRTGLDLSGAVWEVISSTVFMLLFVAVKAAHAFAQTFKSALWTLTWRDLSGTVVD